MLQQGGKITATFGIDLNIATQDLNSHWAATEQNLGITVFADTENDAIDRIYKAVDFLLYNITGGTRPGAFRCREYLDLHGVPHTYSERPSVRGVYAMRKESRVAIGAP